MFKNIYINYFEKKKAQGSCIGQTQRKSTQCRKELNSGDFEKANISLAILVMQVRKHGGKNIL